MNKIFIFLLISSYIYEILTSLGKGWTNVHPDFQNSSKKLLIFLLFNIILVIHIGKDEVLAVTDSGISHFHKTSLLLEDKAIVSIIYYTIKILKKQGDLRNPFDLLGVTSL